MPKDFKQYDSKWGSKKYAGGTMSGCGCGPTSVADLVYDFDNSITPAKVADWLTKSGFAGKAGNGTIRWGITHALEHYGFTDVRGIRNASDDKSGKNDPTMQKFCELIATGDYVGIILFSAGTRGGVTWTSSGHFVTVYKAKKSGSDWLLSVYDGGQRENDGTYSYNKTMKGLCFRAFVGKKPKKPEPKPYSGEFPVITKNTNRASKIVSMAKTLCHPYGTNKEKWAYSTGAPLSAYSTALKTYMGKTSKVDKSDCGYFISTVVRKLGIDSKFVCLKGVKDAFPTSSKFSIVHEGSKIPSELLKQGDVIRYKKTNGTSQHCLIYMGDGKIAEGGRKTRFPVIRKSTKYNNKDVKFSTLQVLRVKETTTTTILKNGSNSQEVVKWKKFLKWYYGDKAKNLNTSTKFGDECEKWTKKFQKSKVGKGQDDGLVGEITIEAAKAVKK